VPARDGTASPPKVNTLRKLFEKRRFAPRRDRSGGSDGPPAVRRLRPQ
jgi:hypothetical protein